MRGMTNPYLHLPRAELYRACQERAGELLRPTVQRTPAQRAALAADTAHLLLVLAQQINAAAGIPGTPRFRIEREPDSFSAAYREYAERLTSDARWEVLKDATDLALGGNGLRELEYRLGGYPGYAEAIASDAGLDTALELLAGLYVQRKAR